MRNRTFFATFLLFLVTVNIGIFALSIVTLRDTTESIRTRSSNDHYIIASSMLNDFAAMDNRESPIDASLDSLLYPYAYLTGNQQADITLFKDDECLYTTRSDLQLPDTLPRSDGSKQETTILRENGGYQSVTSGSLPEPYSMYTVLLQMDVSEAFRAWSRRKNMMLALGGALSLVLALLLLLLLERLFRPLVQITSTSARISSGEYGTRLPVYGRDEVAQMASSFNGMAATIQDQIGALATEAENKQRFIDDFAHELRTPLTAVYGYAEYMQKAAISEEDRQFALESIMAESRRILSMANQLMELANLRSCGLVMEKLGLQPLLEGVLRTLHGRIAEKKLHVTLQCSPVSVNGNEVLLHSLFVNLLENAIKASEDSGPIKIVAADTDGAPTVQIRDQGKGIPAEALDRITEPYFRVDKARSSREGGAGLGLAICREIANRHRVKLCFSSVLGKGTAVAVIFTTS